MARITAVLEQIKTLIETDAKISDLVPGLKCRLSYKKNSEIKTAEMPCAMIVKPSRRTEYEASETIRKHEIQIFIGIIEKDKENAQTTMYELEETFDELLETHIAEIVSTDSASSDFESDRYWLVLSYEYSEVI